MSEILKMILLSFFLSFLLSFFLSFFLSPGVHDLVASDDAKQIVFMQKFESSAK